MNSGLIYEILMYLNSFYFGLYASFKVCVSILKPIFLPYEERTLIREATILLLLCIVEIVRSILGRRSSLSDRGWQAFVSLILTLPSLAIVLYMCWFQAYILKLEILLSALMIALQCAQIISACIFICTMCRPVEYTSAIRVQSITTIAAIVSIIIITMSLNLWNWMDLIKALNHILIPALIIMIINFTNNIS